MHMCIYIYAHAYVHPYIHTNTDRYDIHRHRHRHIDVYRHIRGPQLLRWVGVGCSQCHPIEQNSCAIPQQKPRTHAVLFTLARFGKFAERCYKPASQIFASAPWESAKELEHRTQQQRHVSRRHQNP